MRASWYEKYGPAREVLTLSEIDTPTPAPGEVLVRVHASGVNPSDTKLRSGARTGVDAPLPWPRIIPHSDGAGVIESVGADVSADRIGERVWLWNGQWQRASGTAAEYIALPASQTATLPDGVSFADGACLGIPAMTAHRCLFSDGPIEGKSVLVTGGAGSVARYAIQMAKIAGARVFTTVSGEQKAVFAREAGADHVLNYRSDNVTRRIMEMTGAQGIDRVVDLEFGANLPVTTEIIRTNGIIAAYGSAAEMEPTLPFRTLFFKDVTLRMVLVYLMPSAAREKACRDLSEWMRDGRLTHAIDSEYPLNDVATAHERVESGQKMGAVVVLIPG